MRGRARRLVYRLLVVYTRNCRDVISPFVGHHEPDVVLQVNSCTRPTCGVDGILFYLTVLNCAAIWSAPLREAFNKLFSTCNALDGETLPIAVNWWVRSFLFIYLSFFRSRTVNLRLYSRNCAVDMTVKINQPTPTDFLKLQGTHNTSEWWKQRT